MGRKSLYKRSIDELFSEVYLLLNEWISFCASPKQIPGGKSMFKRGILSIDVLTSYICAFLSSAYDVIVPATGKALVKTDLQIAVPSGCYGRVAPRSGLAVKNFIDVGGE